MIPRTNRADVDRLGDLRAEIKRLQAEEAEIKRRILATDLATVEGEEFVACIDPRERRTLDAQAVIAWYGEKELAPFMRVSKFDVVYVTPRRR